MKPELVQLLNARAQDLDFELGVYLQLDQVKDKYTSVADETVEEMKQSLIEKLGVDLEEIAEDEEISVEEVEDKHIQDALKYARAESESELKVFLTLERHLNQLKNVGATDEELQGTKDFQKRLESVIYERYNITEDDLKELESDDE